MISWKICLNKDEEEKKEYHHKNMHGIDRVLNEIKEISYMKPMTWQQYENQPNSAMDIVNMEYAEMQKAYTAMKTSTGTHSDFVKEMKHLATALVCAIEKMTCDE